MIVIGVYLARISEAETFAEEDRSFVPRELDRARFFG
jgi:hypothetical protein